MNQFQKEDNAPEKGFENPFEKLLGQAFKPIEQRIEQTNKQTNEQESEDLAILLEKDARLMKIISVCAACGRPECSCVPRVLIKVVRGD